MRRASPPKRAGLYFAFTWKASPSRRARHVVRSVSKNISNNRANYDTSMKLGRLM